ncbi:MAG: TraX family protein [Eisenbergiella sp.]
MNTFTLKMIALVLMVIDHIGYYFEGTPSWLRWLGRGSYPVSFLHGLQLSVYKEPEKVSASSVSDESLYDVLFLYRGCCVCFSERLWKSQYFSLHVFGRRAYQHSGAISEGSEKGCRPVGRDSLCPAAVFPHAQYYSLYT